jgi:hypothetical protein
VELAVDTLLRILDASPNVTALKDASGGLCTAKSFWPRRAHGSRCFPVMMR